MVTSLKGRSSTATWESLETFARTKVQEFIQLLLEEEITELLGRQRSQRRAEVDGAVGYRNGHGKPRKLSMQTGTVTIRRPRVRGLEERFESRILPLFERRTKEQRCWNHKALNVLDKLPQRLHGEAKKLVLSIPSSPSKAEAERRRDAFVERYRASQADAVAALQRDWDRMVTFYAFPEEHWKHLRTSNVVESPFASVRLRTSAAKRFKKVPNATVLIWKVLRVAEKRFRRLDAAERLVDVYEGRKFVDGKMVKKSEDQQRAAA